MVVLGGWRFFMSEVPLYCWLVGSAFNSTKVSVVGGGSMVNGKNNYFTEMCSGSEEGSYLRLIDFCITQL